MAFTYQNYSDDYNLTYIPTEGGSTPGKKILSFPEINHIQGTISVRGNTKLPQGDQIITINANLSENLDLAISYKGVISTVLDGTIIGSASKSIVTEALLIGTKSKSLVESVIIKGKKDYDIVITKFKELGYE
jgi:hypothetical protein